MENSGYKPTRNPITSPTQFSVAAVIAAPAPSETANSASPILLIRACITHGLIASSPLPAGTALALLQLLQQILHREARDTRAGYEITDQLIKLTLSLELVPVRLAVADESSGPLLRIENAADFKLPVRTDHGIGIDRQIDCHLSYSRKLVARCKRSGRNGAGDLIDDLPVRRNAARKVQPEFKASPAFSHHGTHL